MIFTEDGVPPEWIRVNCPIRPFDYLEFEYPDVLIYADYENYEFLGDVSSKLKIVFLHNKSHLKNYKAIATNPRTLIFTMDEENIKHFPREKVVYFPFGTNINFFTDRAQQNVSAEHPNILFIIPPAKNPYDYLSFISNIYESMNNPNIKFSVLCKSKKSEVSHPLFPLYSGLDDNKLLNLYISTYVGIDLRNNMEWNNSVLDLLSVGRPVVCFPGGAKAFAKDFYNAFFLKKYDADFLGGLISLLVSDKSFYNYLKNNAPASTKEFSYEKGAQKLEEVLKSHAII